MSNNEIINLVKIAKAIKIEISAHLSLISIDTRGYDIVNPENGRRYLFCDHYFPIIWDACQQERKDIEIVDYTKRNRVSTQVSVAVCR